MAKSGLLWPRFAHVVVGWQRRRSAVESMLPVAMMAASLYVNLLVFLYITSNYCSHSLSPVHNTIQ